MAFRASNRKSSVSAGMSLLHPDFVRRLKIRERIDSRSPQFSPDPFAATRRRHAEMAFGPTGAVNTLAAAQRVASHVGVEMRDPWADKRVLEFCLHLPLDQLVRDGWNKYIARSASAPELEGWVCWRNDKEHLGWDLVQLLMRESSDLI